MNPFNKAFGRTLADSAGDDPRDTLPESPIAEELPEFKVVTKVELEGHGGFKVTANLYRKNIVNEHVFVRGFTEDTLESGIPEAKMDANLRANEYINKLKIAKAQTEEVRYVE